MRIEGDEDVSSAGVPDLLQGAALKEGVKQTSKDRPARMIKRNPRVFGPEWA